MSESSLPVAQGPPSNLDDISVKDDKHDETKLKVSKVMIPTSNPFSRINDGTVAPDIREACSVSTSPDGSRFAVGSVRDGKLALYAPITEECHPDSNSDDSESSQSLITFQGPQSSVESLVFSADSKELLAVWYSGKVIVFDAKTGGILRECVAPEGLRCCSISNDGKYIVLGGNLGWIRIPFDKNFPSNIKEDKFSLQENAIYSSHFSKDGTKLIIGNSYGDAMGCHVYNSQGTKILRTFCEGKSVLQATLSPNGMILAVGRNNGKVHLFNIASGECVQTISLDKGFVSSIQFSRNGQRVFFSTGEGKMVYGYGVWAGEQVVQVSCPGNYDDLAAQIDLWKDDTLLVACTEAPVQAINVRPIVHEIQHEKEVYSSSISPNGQLRAVTYGMEGGFKVYDTTNKKKIFENHSMDFLVSFSPCGNRIVCSGSQRCYVYKKNADENGGNISFEKEIETRDIGCFTIMFLEDSKHFLCFEKESADNIYKEFKTAYIINIDNDSEQHITTTTDILSACIVPQKNLFAIATEESINFYNSVDGSLNTDLTYTLKKDQTPNEKSVQQMVSTSDGSSLLVCFGSQLNVYNFDLDQGVDNEPKQSFSLPLHDNKDIAIPSRQGGYYLPWIQGISISFDDKILVVFDENRLYTLSLDNQGETKEDVHVFPIGKIKNLHFLPPLRSEGIISYYPLYVTYGEYSTTLLVHAKDGAIISDPSLLLRCFAVCDDETMKTLITKHKGLLHTCDEEGRTLAELAITANRNAIVRTILKANPSVAWSSIPVLTHLLDNFKEDLIEIITTENKCAPPFTDPESVQHCSDKLVKLAEDGATNIIDLLLKAGSENCSSGFVPSSDKHLKAFLNRRGLFRWWRSLFLDKNKPCDGNGIVPEASKEPHDMEMFDNYLVVDESKRQHLKAIRCFLPNLSSYEILSALINIDSSIPDEESEGTNVIPQHLKPFRNESLQASIEAAWYGWAGSMFLRRALSYVVWMICIIGHEWTTSWLWLNITSLIAIIVGWFFFLRDELKQMRIYYLHYFNSIWNIFQTLTLVLVLVYVYLSIGDIFMNIYSSTTILSQPNWNMKWFTGLVHFSTLINFLYYFRGIQKASWILYALNVLMKKMFYFMIILLWIILASSFLLTNVKGAFDTKRPIHVFTDTFATAIFGAFESAEHCDAPYEAASREVLILFLILSGIFIIFMNAMIAFISEMFANILDYQKAILAREMAELVVDMYDTMSDNEKTLQGEKYKWVYKLKKQAYLNKLGLSNTDFDADGRRATKVDIQNATTKLEKENGEMRKEIVSEISKKNGEMMKEIVSEIRKKIVS